MKSDETEIWAAWTAICFFQTHYFLIHLQEYPELKNQESGNLEMKFVLSQITHGSVISLSQMLPISL